MENRFSFSTIDRPLIGIVSEMSGITLSVVEKLLSNFCRVNIYSINLEDWKNGLKPLKDNPNIVVNPLEKLGQNEEEVFIFFSLVFSNYDSFRNTDKFLLEKNRIESLRNVIGEEEARVFYLLPYIYGFKEDPRIQEEYQSLLSELRSRERVVFLGQLIGKRMTLTNRDPLSGMFKDAFIKGQIYYLEETYFYPVTVSNAAKYIVRLVLSFNIESERISVLGPRIRSKDFAGILKKVFKKEITIDKREKESFLLANAEDSKIVDSLREVETAIKEVVRWQKVEKDYIEKEDVVEKRKKREKMLEVKKRLEIEAKKFREIKRKEKERKKDVGKKLKRQILVVGKKVFSFKERWERKSSEVKRRLEIKNEKFREIKRKEKERKKDVGKKLKRQILVVGKKVFSFKERWERKPPETKRRLKVKSKKSKKIRLSLLYLILIFLIILLPFLLTGISAITLLYLGKRVSKEDFSGAEKIVYITNKVGKVSTELNNVYLMTPYVGGVYLRSKQISNLVSVASDTMINTLGIVERASDLLTKILGSEDVKVREYVEPVTLDLDSLYRELGFLQNEMDGLPQPLLKYFGGYLNSENFEKIRENVLLAKGLSNKLGDVFAVGTKKKYLILFQNNMELRPTGGFIGSFALVDFQDGKFLGFDVYDVYSADGQLKGYVKPPEPIEKYMKQAVWYLRDANWDPNYPISAKRIEWFLEKEMDVTVDGVIAVDLNVIKDMLDVIGPIYLPSFDKEIDSSNLYSVTQSEVEDNFFPGSRKKANFLMDMSKIMMLDLQSAGKESYLDLMKVIYKNLQERHIQLYFHSDIDREVQKAGWNGSVTKPVCESKNCFADLISLVEANLGVNKANYFIKRNLNLNVLISKDVIKRELDLVLDDSANPALGYGGKYRVYVRLIAPKGAEFDAVEIRGSDGSSFVDPDIKENGNFVEAGVFVEVNPKEKKRIKYVWQTETNLNFKSNGSYNLLLRKQSGVDGYNTKIKAVFPPNLRVAVKPKLLLTNGGSFKYNAYLTRDLKEGFYW